MKRFHVHVSVSDLQQSIRFYSTLFASAPTVGKSDYAKWLLEDPRVNFAISTHRQPVGVNHLGFQVDTDEELRGIAWENFHTLGNVPVYGEDTPVLDHGACTVPVERPASACCVPKQTAESSSCRAPGPSAS